jgi:predicted ester cyclase
MALFAADVTVQISGIGMLQGADAVRDEWLVPFTSAFPDYTHTVNQITVDGTRATADFVFRGTHQAPLLGYEPTGKELVLPIIGTYDVESDLVTNFVLEYEVTIVLDAITP